MAIKTKWDQKELDKQIAADTKRFLIAVGEAGQNEFASNAPFDTGLLANSITYHIVDGKKGEFGTRGSGVPTEKDRVSKPTGKFFTFGAAYIVRIGSGLIYAASVEKRGKSVGWMSKIWDFFLTSGEIEKIQDKVFKI